MKKTNTLFLFLLVIRGCFAQMPSTPAQLAEWLDHQPLEMPGETSFWSSEPTVSVARLRHHTPGKAWAAFFRGLKLANAGAWQQVALELEKAVTIDPAFAEAHNNLGVCDVELKRFDSAAGELRRAIELDPADSVFHGNLSLVLILLHLRPEAEQEARNAVTLDAANSKAQYLLGFLLAQRPETRDKAAEHLSYAAREMPDAHYLLSRIYQDAGQTSRAGAELERYRKAFSGQAKNK
jgi:tetratricopeptide (TPR) repeat protein